MSEANRSRKIIHVDMDCFYAAIEIRDAPDLAGKPIAVGGRTERRGVLTTCNYEARRYGLHSAMATARALQLCPGLILLPVDMDKYRAVSRQIQAIFHDYTEQVEPLSLDEAYLDVTDASCFQGSATRIAEAIRKRIREEHELTASAGVAPNKFLAKVASDWRKPDGLFVIPPREVDRFVAELPVARIPGVGRVTQTRMKRLGIHNCAQLQALGATELIRHFGRFGQDLYFLSRGIDERPVRTERIRKSLSVEETFERDLPDAAACLAETPALYTQLQVRLGQLRDRGPRDVKGVFVKLKFDDFTITTMQAPAERPSHELYTRLCKEAWTRRRRPVRLIGLGIQFRPEAVGDLDQLDLDFDDA